ncbi:hypothetical protein AK812_SmicGene34788 [Symbiodinium microadriaticum]|uniref:Uncharacterized protein n=1 Tax=Symbiodinium microadriaticum TaxID=2951 RepID=A0A1Q9CN53_SYMMI|nr:hypothetical protein AK812_SmicGene34788 [Symbiodinium microadriaticum]
MGVPLNKQRLKLAFRHGVPVRFRQFQSTTSDQKVAARFQKREVRGSGSARVSRVFFQPWSAVPRPCGERRQ